MNLAPEAIQHFGHHHLLVLFLHGTAEEEIRQRINASLDRGVLGARTLDRHPETSEVAMNLGEEDPAVVENVDQCALNGVDLV